MLLFARKQRQTQQQSSSSLHPTPTGATVNASKFTHPILRLQRTIGNQAVGRLLEAGGEIAGARAGMNPATPLAAHDSVQRTADNSAPFRIQAKLTVGAAGDAYEQEADHVAEQVTHAGEAKLRRSCACAGSCSKCQDDEHAEHAAPLVQTSRVASHEATEGEAPPVVEEVLRSPGRTLDAPTRDFFETSFGRDFGHVRVHTDERAASSAAAVGAQAYTVGGDIAFAAGQYAPETSSGRRLLAHELTHVAQQDGRPQARVQRQKATPPPDAAQAAAAKKLRLELTKSKNGAACACVVVIHNDERNARKTAQLMHENCSYNLVLRMPDDPTRDVKMPGSSAMIDPNSLFPEDIAAECLTAAKAGKDCSAGEKDADKQVKKQFFLTLKDCSNSFALPVVALHNNDIEETKGYRNKKAKDKIDVSDLKMDIDKSKEETGTKRLAKLKKLLTDKFSDSIAESVMDTPRKTNIFRWCQASDLSRCHIGDPEHPDNVVWVTKESDFKKLSAQNVNVAFQSEIPTAKKGQPKSESEGDLSTLFLILEKITKAEIAEIDSQITLFQFLTAYASMDFGLPLLLEMYLRSLMVKKLEDIRFINIETPGDAISDQTDAERVRNYEAIVEVLKAVGLHCCGADAAAQAEAEKKIKAGLALAKKK